jgi:hypothetical protein
MTTRGRIRRGARLEALAARTAAKANRNERDVQELRLRVGRLERTWLDHLAATIRKALDRLAVGRRALILGTRRRVELAVRWLRH